MMRVWTSVRFALAILAVSLGSHRPAAADDTASCRVTKQVGAATLLHGAMETPLRFGAAVAAGDRVVTSAGGRVEITCDDGSTIIIGERTNVSLAIFWSANDGSQYKRLLRLLQGILRLQAPVGDTSDRFDVMTDTAITSVRSTHWIVEATIGNTAVFVADGRVAVTARGDRSTVLLEPGFGTDVAAGAAPTPPKAWGQARIGSAMVRTTLQ